MAKFEIFMPKLGESIIEATITKWLKGVGDTIEEDDAIVEIATDKVDSEVPSPVDGKIIDIKFEEGDVVPVGELIAVIATDGEEADSEPEEAAAVQAVEDTVNEAVATANVAATDTTVEVSSDKFFSPLVKSIAKAEGISIAELDTITGSGENGRVNKNDILKYIEDKKKGVNTTAKPAAEKAQSAPATKAVTTVSAPPVQAAQGDRIEEMDRMRKLIADHMVMSKHVSPHVTSFIEVDVTKVVQWRNSIKDAFLKKEGEKMTYTPIFMEAVAQTLRNYPGINASVDGNNIIYRKNINVGMAAALPDGNLIVPVIKNAVQKNLVGLAKDVNDLAKRARANQLQPDEISGGTFTVSNFGTFDSLTGTPIINQPQVAILAIGAIKKRPVVVETPQGDVIAIRHIMMLSMSYDHRVVDGGLAGMYLKDLRDKLENFEGIEV